MKKHVFWNNYFYLSSNRMIDVLLLKWGLECETVRLDSFNADNPSLCASNLPGNHTIHMFIIRADRRFSDSGNIGSVSAFTWWWRLLIKTSYLHHGQVHWKFCTNTVYSVERVPMNRMEYVRLPLQYCIHDTQTPYIQLQCVKSLSYYVPILSQYHSASMAGKKLVSS